VKSAWRIGVLLVGLALFVFAVERTGSGGVFRELRSMSGAVAVIVALSLGRLLLQTQSWALALREDGVDSSTTELMFLRLASQGMGYLTVLGPAVSEPIKIKLLQHHRGSATAPTLVDTGVYWMSAGLVLISGSIAATVVFAHDRGASILFATLVAAGLYFLVSFDAILAPLVARLGKRAPGWLRKAAQIECEIHGFAETHPATIRRMFLLDLACQVLLLGEVAIGLYSLHLPVRPGAVLSIEAAGRAVRLLAGWMPARIGADEGGAAAAFAALGFPAAAGLALALARRFRDMLASLIGLIWLAWRTRTRANVPVLTGVMECKL
jgi:hypothetical protein